jgi:extradiol dioxygenase family protein
MAKKDWIALACRLKQHKIMFVVETAVNSAPGEGKMMSLLDPTGNALEFRLSRHIAKRVSPRLGARVFSIIAGLMRKRKVV